MEGGFTQIKESTKKKIQVLIKIKMMNAASTSNPSHIVDVGEAYPYRSHVIGPNIVTMKLSVKYKYNLWRLQMECLLKSQHMVGFIKGQFPSPAKNGKEKVGDMEAWTAGDSLVKGWILGSLSEEAAEKTVNRLTYKQNNTYFSAKDLWDELRHSYGPSGIIFPLLIEVLFVWLCDLDK